MLNFPPACFGGASAASPATAPTKTTSCYTTRLGEITLTWRRSFFGLSLLVDLQLLPSPKTLNQTNFQHILVRIFLFLAVKRKGSKRITLTTAGGSRRSIHLSWDLSNATFSREWGPEPAEGYSVTVSVDGDVLLIAGNLRFSRNQEIVTEPISTRVYSKLKEIGKTTSSMIVIARFGGRDRKVMVSIDLKKTKMRLTIDGETVLNLRHMQWKFRGSERVGTKGGDRIRVSWDLYRLLFGRELVGEDFSAKTRVGDAVFVLQFENGDDKDFRVGVGDWGAEIGKSVSWSESSSCSSSTTASSMGAVEEWESSEDAELRNCNVGGFTLVVCGRRNG